MNVYCFKKYISLRGLCYNYLYNAIVYICYINLYIIHMRAEVPARSTVSRASQHPPVTSLFSTRTEFTIGTANRPTFDARVNLTRLQSTGLTSATAVVGSGSSQKGELPHIGL